MSITISGVGILGGIIGVLFWGPMGAAVGYGIGSTIRFGGR
jgi:hypothetical protein